MTRSDVVGLLQMILAAWPSAWRSKAGAGEREQMVAAWLHALEDFDKAYIMRGLKPLMQAQKFPPTVAEVLVAARQAAAHENDILANPQLQERQNSYMQERYAMEKRLVCEMHEEVYR